MAEDAPGQRRIDVGKTLLIGIVGSVIPLVGNVVGSFVADWSGGVGWLAVPVTAVGFGVVGAFATAHIEGDSQRSSPSGMPAGADAGMPASASGTPVRRRRRAMALPVGLLVTVLVLAGGGLAVAVGARYVVGWITGGQEGVDRLVSAKTVKDKDVTLTVSQVIHTSDFTRVTVTASNDRPNSITLPLFQNCTLRGADGTTLQADSFRSDWSETLAPGTHGQRGVVVFPGHLPSSLASASLSFATVFEAGFGGPKSLTVSGLALRPP